MNVRNTTSQERLRGGFEIMFEAANRWRDDLFRSSSIESHCPIPVMGTAEYAHCISCPVGVKSTKPGLYNPCVLMFQWRRRLILAEPGRSWADSFVVS